MDYLLLFGVVFILSAIVQNTLNSRFDKYSRVLNPAGMTGEQVARKMLDDHGIKDVRIECVEGRLTDHYNPQTKTVNLSRGVYSGQSIAAAAVAAHECGHVVQHATGYAPLQLRSSLVPIVSFANSFVSWILVLGIVMMETVPALFWFGIILFAATTLFSIVTLPVEINASKRAIAWLESSRIIRYESKDMAVDALKWAAYTYVVAALGSIATLLYYIGIGRSSRR